MPPSLVLALGVGAALGLAPLLLEAAAQALREHPGPRLGQGVLAALLGVLAVAGVQPWLERSPERISGLPEDTGDEYVTPSRHDIPVVPGFGLLDRPDAPSAVVVTG